jgi:hypothetical protein
MDSNDINNLLKRRKDYQKKLGEIGSITNTNRFIKSETERMLLNVENKLKDAD